MVRSQNNPLTTTFAIFCAVPCGHEVLSVVLSRSEAVAAELDGDGAAHAVRGTRLLQVAQ